MKRIHRLIQLDKHFAMGLLQLRGHMVHAGGQAAHWDIQNKANSSS